MNLTSFVKTVAALALVAPLATGTPAHAAVNTLTVTGTGTIDPGLPAFGTSPTFSHVTFSFNAVAAGTLSDVFLGCTFDGTSTVLETLDFGLGAGSIIRGASCNITGNVSYRRTDYANVVLDGNVTLDGLPFTIFLGRLAFVPTSANPTTSYIATGTLVLTG